MHAHLDTDEVITKAIAAWEKTNAPPRGGISEVADHIDHIRKVAGVNHIGVGADFFDVTNHPTVVFNVDGVEPGGDDILQVTGTLTAAGRSLAVTFDARLSDATHERVAVDGEVKVDRREDFGMMWSPLGIAAPTALLVVHGVFAKSEASSTLPVSAGQTAT